MKENQNDLTTATTVRKSDDAATPSVARWNVVGWFGIALVFATGCWIRWVITSGELLWLDELHTGWTVGGSFEQMLTRSAQGNQAPLFFGLAWSVVQGLGTSELSLRLVSLLAGMVAMGMAARFVWLRTQSIAAAMVTLALIAVDETFIWYATEARPYAMLHLLSVVQASCFWRLCERWQAADDDTQESIDHRLNIFGLLLSSWALIYTHYTGVFLLVTEAVFLSSVLLVRWLTRGLVSGTVKQVLVTLILFAVGCLPLLLQMNQAFGSPSDWASVVSLKQFQLEQTVNLICWFGIPLVAVVVSTATVAVVRRNSSLNDNCDRWRNMGWLAWIAIWFLVPMVFLTGLHTWGGIPIALSRYLSVALIAGPIFVGGLIGNCNLQSRWIAIPLILSAIVFVHVRNFRLTNNSASLPYNRLVSSIVLSGKLPLLRTENWESPIDVINTSDDKAKWPLFLFGAVIEDGNALSNPDADFQSYLQFPVRSCYHVDCDDRIVFAGPTLPKQHFDDRYLAEVIEQGGAWILVRHHTEIAAEISNELKMLIHDRVDNATIEINWFGNHNNVVNLIAIEIKK